MFAQFLVVMRTNFKSGAIGGKSAMQRAAHARAQISTHYISAHQTDLGFFLLEKVYQNSSMGFACIGSKTFCIKNMQPVHSVRKNLIFYLSRDTVTGSHSL